MYILNPDEIRIIISFLSLHDKVKLSMTSNYLKRFISKKDIALSCIEKKVHHFFSIVIKPGSELVLVVNNNFIMYVDEYSIYKTSRVHPLFRIRDTNPNCINCNCRHKRLGNIYIGVYRGHIPQYLHTMYYIQRKIPYCIHCFNKWGIDAYINHVQ